MKALNSATVPNIINIAGLRIRTRLDPGIAGQLDPVQGDFLADPDPT